MKCTMRLFPAITLLLVCSVGCVNVQSWESLETSMESLIIQLEQLKALVEYFVLENKDWGIL